MDKLMTLCEAMIHYDRGDAKRIHHFLKVHAFAKQIGQRPSSFLKLRPMSMTLASIRERSSMDEMTA